MCLYISLIQNVVHLLIVPYYLMAADNTQQPDTQQVKTEMDVIDVFDDNSSTSEDLEPRHGQENVEKTFTTPN
ncbi:unnamed protein product, partial [Mesorhabditis spiculigera]